MAVAQDKTTHAATRAPHGDSSATARGRRPWWRLHGLALLAAGLVAGALTCANLQSISPYDQPVVMNIGPPKGVNPNRVHVMPMGNFSLALEGFTYGWPLRYKDLSVRTMTFAAPSRGAPVSERVVLRDEPRALAANVAVAMLMVLCVLLSVERYLRAGRWLQFGLRGLLVGMAVAAVGLSAWRIHGWLETAFGQENLVTRVFEFPVYVYVPVLAGVVLTVYSVFSLAAWLTLGIAGRALKAARRAGE